MILELFLGPLDVVLVMHRRFFIGLGPYLKINGSINETPFCPIVMATISITLKAFQSVEGHCTEAKC